AGEEVEVRRRSVDTVEEGGRRAVDRQHALLDADVAEARAQVAAEEREGAERLGDVDPPVGAPAREGGRGAAGPGGAGLDGAVLVRRAVHVEGMPGGEDEEQTEVGPGERQRRPSASPGGPQGEPPSECADQARRGEEGQAAEPADARDGERAARAGADQ